MPMGVVYTSSAPTASSSSWAKPMDAEHAPAAAAAVVAQRADEHARKANGAAQRFGRGHAVGVAVDEMGKDHTQKALGAVQDAAKGTREHGNSDVIECVLGRGLPQAQSTALRCHFAAGELGQAALQQNTAQQHQKAAQHEPHTGKAEDGGGVAGLNGEQPVAQLDEGECRAPQHIAEDGQQHGKHRRAEDLIQPFRAGKRFVFLHGGSVDAAAYGGVVAVESDGAAAVGGISSKDHALADILALHHGARCQIAHNADLLTDQVFRLEPLCNAGKDAALPLAVKHGQVQQLLAFLQVLAGAHFGTSNRKRYNDHHKNFRNSKA